MKTNFLKFIPLFLISLSIFAQNEQTIELKDSKIHLVTFGKGQPVLILQGE